MEYYLPEVERSLKYLLGEQTFFQLSIPPLTQRQHVKNEVCINQQITKL